MIDFTIQKMDGSSISDTLTETEIKDNLKKGNHLPSDFIDCYCQSLISKATHSNMYAYFAINWWKEGEHDSDPASPTNQNIKTHFTSLLNQNIAYIFIPIHEGEAKGGHYVLAYIDLRCKTISVYDSLGDGNSRTEEKKQSGEGRIRKILEQISTKQNWQIQHPWELIYISDQALQINLNDCGVIVVYNIISLLNNGEDCFIKHSAQTPNKLREIMKSFFLSKSQNGSDPKYVLDELKTLFNRTGTTFGNENLADAETQLIRRSEDAISKFPAAEVKTLNEALQNIGLGESETSFSNMETQLLKGVPGKLELGEIQSTSNDTETTLHEDPKFPHFNIHRIRECCNTKESRQKKINEIIGGYNNSASTGNKFELMTEREGKEVAGTTFFLHTMKQVFKKDPVLNVFEVKSEVSGANTHIIFCCLEESLYAMTTKKAWEVIKKYSDFDFPLDIANKILSDKGAIDHTERNLLGSARGKQITARYPTVLSDIDDLTFVNSFSSETKIKLPDENSFVCEGTRVDIGPGRLKIYQLFSLYQVAELLACLEAHYRKPPSASNVYTMRMYNVPYVEKTELDNYLVNCIISSIQGNDAQSWVKRLDVCHKHYKDYTTAKIKILKLGGKSYGLERFASMPDILKFIRDNKTLKQVRNIQTLNSIRIAFGNSVDTVKEEKFLNFIEGHVHYEEKSYFRMSGMWYFLSEDLVLGIETKFRKILSELLMINTTDSWYLNKPFYINNEKIWSEGSYNKLYQKEENFYFGDCKTPLGIEICDLMRVERNETHLYHVKKDFNQNIRVLCSQARNASVILNQLSINQPVEGDVFRFDELPAYAKSLDLTEIELTKFLGVSGRETNDVTIVLGVQTQENLTKYPNGALDSFIVKETACIKRGIQKQRSLRKDMNKTFSLTEVDLNNEIVQNKDMYTQLKAHFNSDKTEDWLDNLLYRMVENRFLVKYQDEGGIYYNITSKLLYADQKSFINLLDPDIHKTKAVVIRQIYLLFSKWITDFDSLLGKCSLIDLHKHFAFSRHGLKICEIITAPGSPDPKPPKKSKPDSNSCNSSTGTGSPKKATKRPRKTSNSTKKSTPPKKK